MEKGKGKKQVECFCISDFKSQRRDLLVAKTLLSQCRGPGSIHMPTAIGPVPSPFIWQWFSGKNKTYFKEENSNVGLDSAG